MTLESAVAHSAATLDQLTFDARRHAGTAQTALRDPDVGQAAKLLLAADALAYIEKLIDALEFKRRQADLENDTVVHAVHEQRRIQAHANAADSALRLVFELLIPIRDMPAVDRALTAIDSYQRAQGDDEWNRAAAAGRAAQLYQPQAVAA